MSELIEFTDVSGKPFQLPVDQVDAFVNYQLENKAITADQVEATRQQLLSAPRVNLQGPVLGPQNFPVDNSKLIEQTNADISGTDSKVYMQNPDESWLESAGKRLFYYDIDDPRAIERITWQLGLPAAFVELINYADKYSRMTPKSKAIGTAAGVVGGTALASVLPETRLEIAEFFGLIPEGTRARTALSGEQLARVVEGEAYLFGIFGAFSSLSRLSARGATNFLAGLTDESKRLAEIAAKGYKVDTLPAQVGEGTFAPNTLNVLGRMPFIGSPARKQFLRTHAEMYKAAVDLPPRIAPLMSSSELSQKIYKEYRELYDNFTKAKNAEYDRIFLAAERARVVIDPIGSNAAVKIALKDINKNQARRVVKKKPSVDTPPSIETVSIGDDVLEQADVGAVAPVAKDTTKKVKTPPPRADQIVKSFLNNNMKNLADLSLAQADKTVDKINQIISIAYKEGDAVGNAVHAQLAPIKEALKSDVLHNVISKTGDDAAAEQIAKDLAIQDAKFSSELMRLFETSVAKRTGQVVTGGIKGPKLASEAATQTNVDQLLGILVNIDSPGAMKEFLEVMPKETVNEVAARFLGDAIDDAFLQNADGTFTFNANVLNEFLGITKTAVGDTSRREAIDLLFSKSNIPVSSVRDMAKVTELVVQGKVPDVSTYLARRATLGGPSSLAKILTFGAVGAGSFSFGLMYTLAGFYGARQFVSMLTNPVNARFLKDVLSEEVSLVAKKTAYLELVRGALNLAVTGGREGIDSLKTITEEALQVEDETPLETAGDVVEAVSATGNRMTVVQASDTFKKASKLFDAMVEESDIDKAVKERNKLD